MRKLIHYFLTAFITILIGSQAFLWADGSHINFKPSHVELDGTVEYNPSYASMNFYTTSSPTFFNLSSTAFQIVKPFATKASFTNISVSASSGKITFKTDSHGTYRVTIRTSCKYNEGSTVYFQTVKNDNTIVNRTLKQATSGPEFNVAMVNYSSGGHGSSASGLSNLNSADGIYYLINEGATSPGIVATFTFTGVDSPKSIDFINTLYSSTTASHAVGAKIFNYAFNRYTGMTSKTYISGTEDDFPNTGSDPLADASSVYQRHFNTPLPYKNYIQNGTVKFRLRHADTANSSHLMYIDKLSLRSALSAFYLEHTEIVSINDGDTLQMRIGTDVAGTEFYRYVSGIKIDKIGN